MSDKQESPYVTVWLRDQGTFAEMHRSELSLDFVQVKIEERPGPVWVRLSEVRRHSLTRHELDDKEIAVLEAISEGLAGIFPRPWEAWEDEISYSKSPRFELHRWTAFIETFADHTQGKSRAYQEEVFRLVMGIAAQFEDGIKCGYEARFVGSYEAGEILASFGAALVRIYTEIYENMLRDGKSF